MALAKENKKLGRVLSIQSHVVRGYVGNKAAVFPLQLLGHHVDVINSVQFTSMYIHEGERCEGSTLRKILDTLALAQRIPVAEDHPGPLLDRGMINAALPVDHQYLLTGYVGTESFMQEIVRFVRHQKAAHEGRFVSPKDAVHVLPTNVTTSLPTTGQPFLWICDPVMGDNGKPYVGSAIIESYKRDVVPLADVLTPNQYELEWLCDRKIETLEDAILSCRELHAKGPKMVIVTSIAFPHALSSDGFSSSNGTNGIQSTTPVQQTSLPDDELILLASERFSDSEEDHQFIIRFSRLPVYLGGTGDLMAAMLLHGLDAFDGRLDRACERALAVLQGVMRATLADDEPWRQIDVIGCRSEILSPTMKFQSIPITK